MDHNPEICKPYFETGYCPYGDTCIYIHDRTDYKSGHQIEMDYQLEQKKKERKKLERQKRRERGEEVSSGEDSDDFLIKQEEEQKLEDVDSEGFPLKCAIC